MRLRRIALQNVRSFLDRTEVLFDGEINILIGPNGGGKTNLLDAIVIMLRRYLVGSLYAAKSSTPENENRYEIRHNDMLNQLVLEKHSSGKDLPQIIEIEIEITDRDIENMGTIKRDSEEIIRRSENKYYNFSHYNNSNLWTIETMVPGSRITYRLVNGNLEPGYPDEISSHFMQFLRVCEIENQIREELALGALSTPIIYLPVNRAASAINSSIELASYNAFEQKRQSDVTISRTNFSLVQVAIGKLAQKFRLLLEKDSGKAAQEFREDGQLRELTRILERLGYQWDLASIDPLRNAYDVQLTKQGANFRVGRASSGERELLTYLFAIFALDVRGALIVVDEPELHLHPKWQTILLDLFRELSGKTGNQFLLATHAPTFVSPQSISYVSRIYSENQKSRVIRLSASDLPDGKHLVNIVNSQNNERLFFADKVLLVEGLSDRIFFEAALRRLKLPATGIILEVISVGGKGLFAAYCSLLNACRVPHAVLADLDYLEEIGGDDIRQLFSVDAKTIKKDVIDNIKSVDGASLVQSIDLAMKTGSWDHAANIWEYIKSKRCRISISLTAEENKVLGDFIAKKEREGTHVLRKGDLESYLPPGFADKDLGKLIGFVSDPNFWERLDADARSEITRILLSVCEQPPNLAAIVDP